MKPSTTTIPTDHAELVSLKSGRIVAAFVNALPPRGSDLHGTSVEFFFEEGGSCSIDGLIIDVAPKEEAYLLHFGKAMEMDAWQKRPREETGKSAIQTIDLQSLWTGEGLEPLLAGPRDVRFHKRMDGRGAVGEESAFDAIQLCVPGRDDVQSLFLHASQDFPGDVVIAVGILPSGFSLTE